MSGDAGGLGEMIELSIPVRSDLVVLARLTAATVASRAGFGVEEIEDLRLAVEELCLSLVGGDEGGRLRLTYEYRDGEVLISCAFERAAIEAPVGNSHAAGTELSLRILDALVDDHGRDVRDGEPCAWLRKRRARVTS